MIRAFYDSRHLDRGMRLQKPDGTPLGTVPIPDTVQRGVTLGVIVDGKWWAAEDIRNPTPKPGSEREGWV